MCRCAYPQEILIKFFSQSYALFELRNLAKMKDTTETVRQCNSSETTQQNFVKLCSYEGHNVYTYHDITVGQKYFQCEHLIVIFSQSENNTCVNITFILLGQYWFFHS